MAAYSRRVLSLSLSLSLSLRSVRLWALRQRADTSSLSVLAITGTHVVLFGFNVPESARKGLLGFGLHRTDEVTGEGGWLPNFLRFEANDRPGGSASSQRNPLQAFQWGDYGVTPGRRYRYRVQSLYGGPTKPRAGESVTVEVTTERQGTGRNGIYFNRGVAGSQAYARRFGDISPLESAEARQWLSRGLEEGLLRFISPRRTCENRAFNRAGGLAGFAGIIVSISTATGELALGRHLSSGVTAAAASVFAVAMISVLAAVVIAVVKILIPQEGAAIPKCRRSSG
jgi:hypothetical protein